MRVLVTRPEPDASALAQELRARGHEPILAPMMSVEFVDGPAPQIGAECYLAFTSANGVRAFCHGIEERDWPVFAVGAATAKVARNMGFAEVYVAGGDVGSLADMIAEHDYMPNQVFHAAGGHVAGDLAGRLIALGIEINTAHMYTAKAATKLPETARAALERQDVDAILFFSPRTAALFAKLAAAEALADRLAPVAAVCLSHNVATALKPLQFRHIQVSVEPTTEALLEALEKSASQA